MTTPKRYALLSGMIDSLSGWSNFQAWADDTAELLSMMRRSDMDGAECPGWFDVIGGASGEDFCTWFQIIDLHTAEIVQEGDGEDL